MICLSSIEEANFDATTPLAWNISLTFYVLRFPEESTIPYFTAIRSSFDSGSKNIFPKTLSSLQSYLSSSLFSILYLAPPLDVLYCPVLRSSCLNDHRMKALIMYSCIPLFF